MHVAGNALVARSQDSRLLTGWNGLLEGNCQLIRPGADMSTAAGNIDTR